MQHLNGDFLLEYMKRNQLIAVNHHPQCTGKWTRQNRINEDEKYIIDYILTTSEIYDKVLEVTVDEELPVTPFICKMIKGITSKKYTDHNAILVKVDLVAEVAKKENEVKNKWKIITTWSGEIS